jgi:hypothetical protein
MSRRSRHLDERIALHEASHTIVGLHLGFEIDHVSVEPGQTGRMIEFEGGVRLSGANIVHDLVASADIDKARKVVSKSESLRQRIFELAISSVSGLVGERLFLGVGASLEEAATRSS